MNPGYDKTRAGFGIRLCAGLIDLLLTAAAVILAASLFASFGRYVPLEATILVGYAIYTMVGVAVTGQTVGSWLCGLRVTRRNGATAGWLRAIVRACAVGVFQCLLGLPFLILAVRKNKRGWQDIVTGTIVAPIPGAEDRRRRTALAVTMIVLACVGVWFVDNLILYRMYRAWWKDADSVAPIQRSNDLSIREVATVTDAQRAEMADWLSRNTHDPIDYIVDVATQHQVTLIGECHGIQQNLDLLNKLIPRLYAEAGVRAIAMECCLETRNRDLERIVNAETFDEQGVLDLARQAPWRSWGYRGYWDMLKTVWQFNRSMPSDAQPLQVVGMFPEIDLISLALVKEGPGIEKLRIPRVIVNLPVHLMADAIYARSVEQVAFDQGLRTVVWVGAAHTRLIDSLQGADGRIVKFPHRMGSMLFGRYGDRVEQIILHNRYELPAVATLIEQCIRTAGKNGLAFDTADSPFGSLYDRSAPYALNTQCVFSDQMHGYIFLVPMGQAQNCEWLDGFISRRMFGWYKPSYEMAAGRNLNDPAHAAEVLETSNRF